MSAEILDACYALAGLVASWPVIRALRVNLLRSRAGQKMETSSSERQAFAKTFSHLTGDTTTVAELGAYASLTAAEFVWTWASISPEVIKAADFSSSYGIHNGFQFAEYVHTHLDTLSGAAKDGFLNHLLGYLGEQQAAELLIHQGHLVQVAASATQPVWDMYVDGHAANIKTVADIASIKAEAAAHPGVLYLVPEDAHGHAAGNIAHLSGFSHESAKESLHEAVSSAHGEAAVHGLVHHLPVVTIAFAAYRNYKAVQKGKDSWVAVHHGIVETAGRGTGVFLGAQSGAAIGSLLGPLGSMAGAMVGGVAGAMFGGILVEKYKRIPFQKAQERFEQELNIFGDDFKYHMDEIKGYLSAPLINMRRSLHELDEQLEKRKMGWRWFLWPDFYTVLLHESVKTGYVRVATEDTNVGQVNSILDKAVQSGNYKAVGLMMVNSPAIRELIGFDQNQLNRVNQSRQKLLFQRKQLNPDFIIPA